MPQIGWSELLVIIILAVLLIGPKDLPIVIKKISSIVRSIKSYISQFQNEVEKISHLEPEDFESKKNNKKDKKDS
jgi:sec-independent protein translocase protein TatB